MKILFVTNEIPYPPDNGVRIVSHNAMRLMQESGYELALAVLTEEQHDVTERFDKAKSLCQNDCSFMMKLINRNKWFIQIKSLFHNQPYPIERYQDQLFRKKLIKLIAAFNPDVVHLDIITMTRYYDAIPIGIGVVGSINDSYSLTLENLLLNNRFSGLQYLYRRFQLFQSKAYEAAVYKKIDVIHVMTDVDASYLRRLNSEINVTAIPNGVNPKLFHIKNSTFISTDVIFVAKLVGENIRSLRDFLTSCWPKIHKNSPGTLLYIVGAISDEAYSIKEMTKEDDSICMLGYVENIEEAYAKCGIAVVPINKNCGIINKSIEAMASGMTVVGFDKSFAGIKGAIKNKHFISVLDYEAMSLAVVEMISNKGICQDIKSAAFSYAVQNFSWSNRIEDFKHMYQKAKELARDAQ